MPETLRDDIPNPTLHQNSFTPANEEIYDRIIAEGQNPYARQNQITKQFPEIAYETAAAIKPEIDRDVELQRRIDNPNANSMHHRTLGTIVVDNVPKLQLEQKAVRVDLERNAERAVDIATKRGIGLTAISH